MSVKIKHCLFAASFILGLCACNNVNAQGKFTIALIPENNVFELYQPVRRAG